MVNENVVKKECEWTVGWEGRNETLEKIVNDSRINAG